MAIELESLLAHQDFIHALARRLVLDESDADDISQQTWLAAIESPPQTSRSPRNWLKKIARNFALMAYRTDKNRRQREKVAARRERIPSAAEIYEQEVMRRRVVDEVMALDEAHRDTILLRFYEL